MSDFTNKPLFLDFDFNNMQNAIKPLLKEREDNRLRLERRISDDPEPLKSVPNSIENGSVTLEDLKKLYEEADKIKERYSNYIEFLKLQLVAATDPDEVDRVNSASIDSLALDEWKDSVTNLVLQINTQYEYTISLEEKKVTPLRSNIDFPPLGADPNDTFVFIPFSRVIQRPEESFFVSLCKKIINSLT